MRCLNLVGAAGFELATPCAQGIMRAGVERGQADAGARGPEREAQADGRRSEPGPGSAADGDLNKRMELASVKAAVELAKETFGAGFSERGACGLMKVAVSTFHGEIVDQ